LAGSMDCTKNAGRWGGGGGSASCDPLFDRSIRRTKKEQEGGKATVNRPVAMDQLIHCKKEAATVTMWRSIWRSIGQLRSIDRLIAQKKSRKVARPRSISQLQWIDRLSIDQSQKKRKKGCEAAVNCQSTSCDRSTINQSQKEAGSANCNRLNDRSIAKKRVRRVARLWSIRQLRSIH